MMWRPCAARRFLGTGIGLVSRVDAEHDILAGDLVAPLGVDALRDMPPEKVPGFYLVLPCAHHRSSRFKSLRFRPCCSVRPLQFSSTSVKPTGRNCQSTMDVTLNP